MLTLTEQDRAPYGRCACGEPLVHIRRHDGRRVVGCLDCAPVRRYVYDGARLITTDVGVTVEEPVESADEAALLILLREFGWVPRPLSTARAFAVVLRAVPVGLDAADVRRWWGAQR